MTCDYTELRDFVEGLDKDSFNNLIDIIESRLVKELLDINSFEEYALKLGRKPICPYCSNEDYILIGHSSSNSQRYRCKYCNKTYGILSNSIFNSTKKRPYTWIKFINLMIYNVPLECIEFNLNISHNTAFLWRHKIFSTVNEYQNDIELKGTIWVDEIYIEDLSIKRPEGKKNRGLSKYKKCIVIGIDIFKNIIVKVSGNGKISTKRFNDSLIKNIEKKSTIVHDGEHAHYKLIEKLSLVDEYHKANIKDKEYLEAMNLINSFSSWLKRYLFRFIGMKMDNLQSYLNWFVYQFKVKLKDEKYPKTKRIIRHLLLNEGQYIRESSDS